MFNIYGKNRKSKKSKNTQVDKTTEPNVQYEEKFNEIILNDLIPEEKKDSSKKVRDKKKKGINFSLSNKKKQSSETKKENKESDKTVENNKTIEKKENKEKTKKKPREKKQPIPNKKQKNSEDKETKKIKKNDKNKKSKKRVKSMKEEEISVKSKTDNIILEEDSFQSPLRTVDDNKEDITKEEKTSLKDIVWSEDKFPKK